MSVIELLTVYYSRTLQQMQAVQFCMCVFICTVNSIMKIQKISFTQAHSVWHTHLWPDRQSAIEPVSVMTWPFADPVADIDMSIQHYEPTFWGVFLNDDLVGVNSGHRTSATQYRSRGLWVDPLCRSQGFAQLLFTVTQWQARQEGCDMVWSIPRQSALNSYTRFGFETVGDFFATETSDSNIYVMMQI